MIKDIHIINFQAHKETLLSLSEGVNIISGRSHSGKSSIMRALRWAFLNKPIGDGFRRDGIDNTDEVTTAVSFSDDKYIIRKRDNSDNVYKTSEHKDQFSALRGAVPEEINGITKIGPEHIQTQGEKYFLIGKTPGQIARELNKVVGLELIDKTISAIKKKVSDTESELKSSNVNIDKIKSELDEYEGVDELVEIVTEIQNLRNQELHLTGKVGGISGILLKIDFENESIEECNKVISLEKSAKTILSYVEKVYALKDKKDKVSEILSNINKHRDRISSCELVISLEKEILSLSEDRKEAENRAYELSKIETLYRSIGRERKRAESLAEALESLEKRKSELIEKLSYCQYCGADKAYWNLDRVKQ